MSHNNVHDGCHQHSLSHLDVVPGMTKAAATVVGEEERASGPQSRKDPQRYCHKVDHVALHAQGAVLRTKFVSHPTLGYNHLGLHWFCSTGHHIALHIVEIMH